MSTATDEQLDLLQALDFQPGCEHLDHVRFHDPAEPAGLYVEAGCTQCTDVRRYLLCKSGWAVLGQDVVGCDCGAVFYRDEAMVILQEL